MVFIVVGQLVYGPGDGKKKRRRRRKRSQISEDHWESIIASDQHLMEVLQVKMEAIVNNIKA